MRLGPFHIVTWFWGSVFAASALVILVLALQ